MRISKKLIIAATALMTLGATIPVAAQIYSPEVETEAHRNRIVMNCTTAQQSLKQLHVSDAALRVNRGQLYESIGTKLMARLNSRIASNQLDGAQLVSVAAQYDQALTAFRAEYVTYERGLNRLLGVTCSSQPDTFYKDMMTVRDARLRVGEREKQLHAQIDAYMKAFDRFTEAFEEGRNG